MTAQRGFSLLVCDSHSGDTLSLPARGAPERDGGAEQRAMGSTGEEQSIPQDGEEPPGWRAAPRAEGSPQAAPRMEGSHTSHRARQTGAGPLKC